MTKIPIFYWKDDLDSFLGAILAKKFLPPTSLPIPLGPGDTIPDLDGCYPVFLGVDFSQLASLPDMTNCGQCVFVSRYNSADQLLSDEVRWPGTVIKKLKVPLRCRIFFNDHDSIAHMTPLLFSNKKRRDEVIPPFVRYIIDAIQSDESNEQGKAVVEGVKKDQSFLLGDAAAFEQRLIAPFPSRQQDMIKSLEEAGQKKLDNEDEMILKLIERNTTITDFAGYQVKLVNVPEEFANKAGAILAKGMPFAVVIEDQYANNIRVYHLYSTPQGLDVSEVGKPYKAVGNARYATFTAKINFTNHKFV